MKKGFTLIEMLIVIAIIAILFAIAIPQFQHFRKTWNLTCTSTSGKTLWMGNAKRVTNDGNVWKFETLEGEKIKLTGDCIEKETNNDGYRSLN